MHNSELLRTVFLKNVNGICIQVQPLAFMSMSDRIVFVSKGLLP